MPIHVIWEFHPKPDKTAEFEREYSASGVWGLLFRKSREYVETMLLHDAKVKNRYLVVDVWQNVESYEAFKRENAQEYSRIDRRCEELTENERLVGIFDVL